MDASWHYADDEKANGFGLAPAQKQHKPAEFPFLAGLRYWFFYYTSQSPQVKIPLQAFPLPLPFATTSKPQKLAKPNVSRTPLPYSPPARGNFGSGSYWLANGFFLIFPNLIGAAARNFSGRAFHCRTTRSRSGLADGFCSSRGSAG